MSYMVGIMWKQCTKCGEQKLLEEFSKHVNSKDGHAWRCKKCSNEHSRDFRGTPSGVYTQIKGRALFDNRTKKYRPFELSREEFLKWYSEQEMVCGYCDLPEKHIHDVNDIYNNQVLRLTIDCKNNAGGYNVNNIILACKRCNALKSDLLSYDEMREFSLKYLKPKWEAVLHGSAIDG